MIASDQKVKNIVFDIGNVMVKWAPQDVVATLFPESNDPDKLSDSLFKSQIWYDLNLGNITEKEAIAIYATTFGIEVTRLEKLMCMIKESLTPLAGSFELLDKLYKSGFPLFSITDNVKEIVLYLKTKYDFWSKFKGVVISADISVLKPDPKIYKHLIEKYNLLPEECIFFDDLSINVEGAKKVGMNAIQFTTALQCEKDLRDKFGFIF